MADLGTLRAFITVDNTGLLNGTRNAARAVEVMSSRIGRSLAAAGASISSFGKTLTIGLTLPITAAGIAMVKVASDAEEAGSKFNTVFKDVRGKAGAAAKELSTSFGLSNVAAKELLGNTGDLLSGFGFTGDAALDLSVKTNQLAVDLASFTNVEGGTERASRALTKALLGERESVKELGIAILESDVKQRVARNTADGMTFATMRQAKAYATLQLATEQSKNAIGDFTRTQDSVANQFRILGARVTDLAVNLGTMLLPLAIKFIDKALELIAGFQELTPSVKANIIVFAGLAAAIGPIILIFGKLTTLTGILFLEFGALTSVIGFLLTPIGLFVVALAGVVAILIKVSSVTEVLGKTWVALRTTIALVLSGIGTLLSDIIGIFRFNVIAPLQELARILGVDLPAGFDNFADTLNETQKKLASFGEGQAKTAADMSMNWGDAWGSFKEDMTSALEFAEAFLAEKGVNIKEILDKIAEGLEIKAPGAQEGGPPTTGPGSNQEQTNLDKSMTAWGKWLSEQRQFSKVWDNMWSQTAVNVADGFAEGFADAIVTGRSFKKVMVSLAQDTAKQLIAQALKSAIAKVAINQTVTATNAAAEAPSIYAIPLYVGIALALFASAAGGLGGGGGGGGGGGRSAAPADTSSTAITGTRANPLAVTQFTGPTETGEGGADRQQAMQAIIVQIDGEAIVSAVVQQTKDGVGDGANTLALATGEE